MPSLRRRREQSLTLYQPLPSAPIDSLVDDTLRIVFEHCCLTGRVPFFDPTEVQKICLVSRRWYRVARDHAVLWTHIHIENNHFAQLQFELSSNAPLQILYGHSYHLCPHSPRKGRITNQTLDVIEDNMYRVELLSFTANLYKLEQLGYVDYLMPILFSASTPRLKTWNMCLESVRPPEGRFQELLASPFCNEVLQVKNIHWQGYRPDNYLRYFNGLTHLVIKHVSLLKVVELELLSILRSNPALEELDIGPSVKLAPSNETCLDMKFLKVIHLRSISQRSLKPFLHAVSLPAVQDFGIVAGRVPDFPEPCVPICLRDTFLGSPSLDHILFFLESLSVSVTPSWVYIDATGPSMQRLCVSINYCLGANALYHVLDVFPNLTRLSLASEAVVEEEINIGKLPGLKTLEISGIFSPTLIRAMQVHSSLPSLLHLILRPELPRNNDEWMFVLELLSESESQRTCTVIPSSNMDFQLPDEIFKHAFGRKIHLEIQPRIKDIDDPWIEYSPCELYSWITEF